MSSGGAFSLEYYRRRQEEKKEYNEYCSTGFLFEVTSLPSQLFLSSSGSVCHHERKPKYVIRRSRQPKYLGPRYNDEHKAKDTAQCTRVQKRIKHGLHNS